MSAASGTGSAACRGDINGCWTSGRPVETWRRIAPRSFPAVKQGVGGCRYQIHRRQSPAVADSLRLWGAALVSPVS